MPRFLLLQFSWVTSRQRGGCGYCTPPPVVLCTTPPPRTTHANYVCAGPGVAVGILVRWLVFYSMAQAWSNTYEPVLSLYLVTACAGGIILFRPGICPCWWQFPIADHRVIHRRRMFVNLECLDRLLHRPLRKSRPDLPFHICNH